MTKTWIWISALVLCGVAGCASLGDYASDDPGFEAQPGNFEGRFIAVSDADMAGSAYGDGKIEPFEGALDEITLFAEGAPIAAAPAPNSVVSWPQIVDVSRDGRHAFVIETFGSLPPGTEQVESAYSAFPKASTLRVFSIEGAALKEVATVENVGSMPQSVEVSSDGRFVVIGSESDGAELTIIPLDAEGMPGEPRFIDLAPPYKADDREPRIRTLHLAPDGRTLAANVGNVRVQFYDLTPDNDGIPQDAIAINEPIEFGVRLAVGRWTPDSRFFIITDVNAYDSTFAMLTQRGGQVHVISPPSNSEPAKLIDSSRVGRFAEGLELSDDGTMIASIAMERTYLPELFFLETWPRRRTYMLAVLSLDPQTGELTELDRIRAAGVLPEDVIFDETGRNLAVAVFHRRKGPDRLRGFIDYFEIDDNGALRAQNRTQAVMRGPHDLVRLPD